MKLLLIAGHGAGDGGATGVCGGVTYREADETRRMVGLLQSSLSAYQVEVQVYDTSHNAYLDYTAGKLSLPKVDYVLELHFNALSQSAADGKTKGVECYVTTSEAGITVEEGICKAVASCGLTNRGVKRKNFSVIAAAKKAGMSSALLELCFIDDPDDMAVYLANREKLAEAIAAAVCAGFGIPKKEVVSVTEQKASQPSAWAEEACKWAVAQGIVLGDDAGDCKWHEPITKEQMALMLYRALH